MKTNLLQKNIPKGWQEKKLGDLVYFQNGFAFNSSNYSTSGKVIVRMSNISTEGNLNINNNNKKYIDIETYKQLSDFHLIKGDLVMCMTDVSKDFGIVGKTALIDKDDEYILNQRVGRIRPINNLDINFLHYFTNSEFFLNKIYEKVTGSAQYNLSTQDIKNSLILVPTIKEQKSIADILENVDKNIATTEKVIKETEKLKKGLMQQLFTYGIGHTKFKNTKIGEIPEEWEVTKLSDITELITKGTTPTTYGHLFTAEGVNFFKIENIDENGNINMNECKHISTITHEFLKRSQLFSDDILFSIAGALGRIAIIKSDQLPANVNQAIAIIRLKDKATAKFVAMTLITEHVQGQTFNKAVQMAQANVSLSQLAKTLIPWPSKNEQHKIVEILSAVDEKISVNKKLKEKLNQIKKGLMSDLLSGKVRV